MILKVGCPECKLILNIRIQEKHLGKKVQVECRNCTQKIRVAIPEKINDGTRKSLGQILRELEDMQQKYHPL